MASNESGSILIKQGKYVITDPINGGTCNNVDVEGEGIWTILELKSSIDTPMISLSHVANWSISNLQIDGISDHRGTSQPRHGIDIYNCSQVTVKNCTIHDFGNFGVIARNSTYISIVNCEVFNCDANCIQIGTHKEKNIVENDTCYNASDVGISARGSEDISIKGNFP